MAFWQRAHEGELMVDHRASPGLPEDVARKVGFDPELTKEGRLFEAAILGCNHCGQFLIKNPGRNRERASCVQCDNVSGRYICDLCDDARREPGYVHRSYQQIKEMIASGEWTLESGCTLIRPVLVSTRGQAHG